MLTREEIAKIYQSGCDHAPGPEALAAQAELAIELLDMLNRCVREMRDQVHPTHRLRIVARDAASLIAQVEALGQPAMPATLMGFPVVVNPDLPQLQDGDIILGARTVHREELD
jgi:hypothetical protein